MRKGILLALFVFCVSLLSGSPLFAADTIRWQKPEKIAPLNIFENLEEDLAWIKEGAVFQRVGTIVDGIYAGGTLIIAYVTTGPFMDNVYHLIKQDAKITLLRKYSDDSSNEDYPFSSKKVHVDVSYAVPALEFPKTLKGPKPRQTLTKVKGNTFQFSTKGLKKMFTHAVYGTVYGDERGFFLIKSPSGQAISYEYTPDFPVTSIQWSAGQKKIAEEKDYTYASTGGCGTLSSLSIAALTPDRKKIKQVGRNAKGDPIYFFKNSDNKYLKYMYETYVIDDKQFGSLDEQREKKVSYKKFLSIRPAFFWIDPFGRLIEYRNSKLVTLAECGKPVIYLYPEKTQDVSVSLAPLGGFTKSEPPYEGGWLVQASPNGALTDYRSGGQYPYLFWEGRGIAGKTPSRREGFMVARADVHSFLETALEKLGLNSGERRDFEEFWEPRMTHAPYYEVRFDGNRLMDEIAPLSITPKPQTVIRILMDYIPLENPREINPQTLVSPARKGFTVIEWGGVLR